MQGYDYEGTPFPAWAADGTAFRLTPLYRLKPVPQGWERDNSADYLVRLRTDLWRWAERDGKGRYRLVDWEPNLILTSDHPDAV
jgi:hypothetical protein